MGTAASPPPGPPSTSSSDIDSEPVSLPPQSLVCNAAIGTARQQAAAWNVTGVELGKAPPCSVEAGQEFCSSAAAQRSVATSVTGLSVPLTAQESSSMATPAVQNPRKKKKRRDRQRDGPAKERAPWIRELGEKWRALSEEERAKQPRWPPVKPSKPAGVSVGPPAIVAGAAIGARVPVVVGAEASSPPAPPSAPPPALLPAAAPLLGLSPCATTTTTTTTTTTATTTATTTTPWASLPIALAVPAPHPFPATAPGYPNPLAVDQIELANRLAVSRMAEAGPPLAGWPAVTAISSTRL